MKIILQLIAITTIIVSCNNKSENKNVNEESKILQLQGHYDSQDDIWIHTDKNYETPSEFRGGEYASFWKIDEEGNSEDKEGHSLGMGLIDKTGKVIIQPKYKTLQGDFNMALCKVQNDSDKYGLVNKQGLEIVAPQFDDIMFIDEYFAIDSNMLKVVNNKKSGFINLEGKIITPIKYEGLELVGKNRIMFMTEPAKWGIMDYSGNIICPAIFTSTNKFENGKTSLQKEDGENYTVFEDGKIVKQ